MSLLRVMCIAGARPNFMKIAPILQEIRKTEGLEARLIHTGQHYDPEMSEVFFRDLEIPPPDTYLGVGSGTQAGQTSKILTAFEEVIDRDPPDLVLVVGDVNSTLACSLVAAKSQIPIAHVEAGLRSFDRSMPEEINRLVTDVLATLLFTTSRDADENLRKEGIPSDRVHFVGNVMIDTLLKFSEKAEASPIRTQLALDGAFALLTLHRPSNVDDSRSLQGIFRGVADLAREIPVVFPAHPRTTRMLEAFGITVDHPNIKVIEPLGYLDFLHLERHARLVLTDSGGIQEETTVLGVPCLTLRFNTERPITVSEGTNVLVGNDPERITREARRVLSEGIKTRRIPELWDGKAASRIVGVLQGIGR